ncbi:conserved membrane hypothetical protein [Tenacibaculum dicentrarchi]|uniref:Uncharacterized protein n=1 Tax=Tenacibaculum dicentrarchi TaxID=669041 RepID=A0ABM9NXH6_9FLAO|nr:conserved membrane hypothetical protein [Tenacibaculum dicentrarchi]
MKKAGIIMSIGALLLLSLFKFPLWNIMLGAPQYPDPLGMNIYIEGIKGVSEFDLTNIDGLNHYIGMKVIPKPSDMWEFSVFPKVIAGMSIVGILIGLFGYFDKISYKWFLGWFSVMAFLGLLGMYDFNQWLIEYGSDLDPHAIIKVVNSDGTPMSYKPPLLGYQKLLNFDVTSLPHTGGYLMFLGMLLTVIAFFVGKKETEKNQ